MTKVARKTLFWLFIAIFIIAAPLSVLYTAGYRYNAKNGTFVRTGVISITTIPRNISISIDGKPTEKTTPFVVKRLVPGQYEVELYKDGFHSWLGGVDVHSGETTNLLSIQLFLKEDPSQLLIKTLTDLEPSPNGQYVAYFVKEGGWEELWMYDLATDGPKLIDRSSSATENNIELSWSSDSSKLMITSKNKEVRIYKNTGEVIPINNVISKNLNSFFWHPSNGHILYASSDEKSIQYDFETEEIQTFKNPDEKNIVIDASTLSFIDNGSEIELHQKQGEHEELLALLPRATYTIKIRDGSYILLQDTRKNIILLNIRSDQPILLETNAQAFDWNEEGNELVYSDGNEVNIYSPEIHHTEFITRQSDFIKTISWHPSGRNIFIGTSTKLSSIESYRIAKQRSEIEIGSIQYIDKFWLDEDGKTAYFYGTVEGATGLYSLRLSL